jgi:cytochrome c oxidase subunit 2
VTRRDKLVAVLITLVVGAISLVFGWATMVGLVQDVSDTQEGPAVLGAPVPWQLNFQLPFSPVQHALYGMHNLLFMTNVAITALVAILVAFVIYRFRKSRNPEPSRTTHNTLLEVAWTVVPVLVIVALAIPSFRYLRLVYIPPIPEMTLKVTGRQWFWDYTYPDNGAFTFSSVMLKDNELPPEQRNLRLLATDNYIVLPVETVIRIQITAADVVHAWGVPSLGVMRDAIPGRLNEAWTRIEREGLYFGACRELCGQGHAYMPVAIQAVSKERFALWVMEAKQRFAEGDGPESTKLAAARGP